MPEIVKELKLDLLDTSKSPALSTTSDIPVIETKPDASNEGKPPATPAAPSAKAEDKTQPESATGPEEEPSASDQPEKKPARGVQKRLDQLTSEREEQRKLYEAERAEKQRLLALLEEGKKAPPPEPKPEAPAEPVQEPEPQRPKRADFTDPDAYDAALDKYIDERAAFVSRQEVVKDRTEREAKARADAEAKARQSVLEAHNSRVTKAQEKYADWKDVAEAPDVDVSMAVASAILTHEQGPDIQYWLGQNKAEAARIFKLPVAAQLVEIGIVAHQLRAPAATPTPAPAPAPKPLTNAPPPIKPAATGSSDTERSLEELGNEGSMEEYAAKRKAQLQAERRPGYRR